jgi:hypothetical protein
MLHGATKGPQVTGEVSEISMGIAPLTVVQQAIAESARMSAWHSSCHKIDRTEDFQARKGLELSQTVPGFAEMSQWLSAAQRHSSQTANEARRAFIFIVWEAMLIFLHAFEEGLPEYDCGDASLCVMSGNRHIAMH